VIIAIYAQESTKQTRHYQQKDTAALNKPVMRTIVDVGNMSGAFGVFVVSFGINEL
jgi:hypothetical protein